LRLHGEPSAYAKQADGSVLFVTTSGLRKITESGDLEWLPNFPRWVRNQYLSSMVVTADGTIFIEMRMFVLWLQPDSSGYKQDWLLPKECQSFYVQKFDCVCKP
jgi:hypothetical protein